MLHGFAFTMVVGIITGTYSSVFIAAAIVSFWRGTGPTRAAAHAPAASYDALRRQPTRRQKPQRKARAVLARNVSRQPGSLDGRTLECLDDFTA